MDARVSGRRRCLGGGAAGDPRAAGATRGITRARARRDRVRPRPGRVHRLAHRLLGRAGPGRSARASRCCRSTPCSRSPKTRAASIAAPRDVWVAMDARMDEVYAAHYAHADARWHVARRAGALHARSALNARWREQAPLAVARQRAGRVRRAARRARCAAPRRTRGRSAKALLQPRPRSLGARAAVDARAGAAAVPARQGGADDRRARRAAGRETRLARECEGRRSTMSAVPRDDRLAAADARSAASRQCWRSRAQPTSFPWTPRQLHRFAGRRLLGAVLLDRPRRRRCSATSSRCAACTRCTC